MMISLFQVVRANVELVDMWWKEGRRKPKVGVKASEVINDTTVLELYNTKDASR